ncbi:citrate/2-methylcitrate synthase [Neomoorella mulderi]|uniref:Citrate synthase n=1 Tax=Moorella mulderi DSM 14980 TaxID=1122241 RepID=A0A151AWD6_9FIRM|nr:citrate/2-methylcitrate synthase [Moorella mulderi]KYH31727.1 citrate synthase [Moorella mulderi DSM 14980]
MQIDGLTYLDRLALLAEKNNYIEPDLYEKYNVKRGLRNSDGTGVLVGLTEIGEVHGYILDEGERIPDQGRLLYRGIDIWDIVKGFQKEGRYGFEEVCYLLLFGELPDRQWLEEFTNLLAENRCLPDGFVEDMILKAPSNDIMNKLARSVLASYSYDKNPDDLSIKNVVRQSIELIARFPIMVAYGYQAKVHFYENQSLYIHLPRKELSTAENFLYMIRPDNHYTRLEAELLDLALVLHAEHGGGNNSTFTVHVVSSTGTDIYSVIAAAVGSLKGPKHGGANIKVMEMIDDIKTNVRDWADEEEIKYYLTKILNKEAFDKKGLIYGLGHAVYTLSDPRAVLLKNKAAELAREKNMEEEFGLYLTIEKVAPELFAAKKGTEKIIAPNVDFYSGFVYKMLNIPVELYTPIFAIARISGWCAHLLEELVSGGRIIRPAYKNVIGKRKYIPLEQR